LAKKRAKIETIVLDTESAATSVKMMLRVPRGLLEFLEAAHCLGGDEPKVHLEKNVLAKELEYVINSLPEDIFDVRFVRTRYGEGSDLSKSD